MTEERALEILNKESRGWCISVMTGNDVPDFSFEVFRPDHSAAVISAPYDTLYKEIAKLWKQEFDSPKPKPIPKSSRYTRQQEKAAAALEERLRTEGLNDIQKQQMQDMIAAALRPIAQEQQETRSAVSKVESEQSALAKTIENQTQVFKQLVPALQQISSSWYQPQLTYPGAMYGGMPPANMPSANMPAAHMPSANMPTAHMPSASVSAAGLTVSPDRSQLQDNPGAQQ